MTGSARTPAVCALIGLVAVSGYTVVLGANGWLWFGWVVLVLVAVGMAMGRRT